MPVDVRSVSLSIIAFAAVMAMLHLAQEVIIPFVVSGLLFYALDPIVDWLQRWRLPRVARRRARPARLARRCRCRRLRDLRRRDGRGRSAPRRRAQAARRAAAAVTATDRVRLDAANGAGARPRRRRCVVRGQHAQGRHAGPDRRAAVPCLELPLVRLDGRPRHHRPGGDGRLPHLLPAGRQRPLQAQAGEAHRPDAGQEAGDGADPRRDQHAGRALPAGPDRHQRDRRHR